jgi:hypothetical protein
MRTKARWVLVLTLLLGGRGGASLSLQAGEGGVNLLAKYPSTLSVGDTVPEHARPWAFGESDIFRLAGFSFQVDDALRVESGPADVGIGHCVDGAVWAVVIPRAGGQLTDQANNRQEAIAQVWLRFHPAEINRVFPKDTVFADGDKTLASQISVIANAKIRSSWQANGMAMIPEPKDLTVDVDTKDGPRRFFVVDTDTKTAKYVAAFEQPSVRPPPAITPALAEAAFDQLWEAFDRDYAMFVLRPEVDWTKLREQHRPMALKSKSAYAFASVCAEMLKPLRDLHIWLTVAGADVPVFNRPRQSNANPNAYRSLLGDLQEAGRRMQWTVTGDKIGFIAIHQWNDESIPADFDEVLGQMRDTRGLIIDVRLNGGGGEPLARQVAARFLDREVVYAYSQYRNGPQHADLTEKKPRQAGPGGPWRYNRPVVLLIGQRCMSSNESFIAMMAAAPQVVTMGDRTCGSSGNPKMVKLPLDISVSVPQWIDYLPDGTPLDERGVIPKVPFAGTAEAFQGERDALLSAALQRLKEVPLPEKPIQEAAPAGQGPRVIWTSPHQNETDVEAATELRVRFDQPMDPYALRLEWEEGGFVKYDNPHYEPEKNEFIIPATLAPGVRHRIALNKQRGPASRRPAKPALPRDGFQSRDHSLAGQYIWRFSTKPARPGDPASKPRLISVSPASGSSVPMLTLVELTFDQPMMPPDSAHPYVEEHTLPGSGPRVVPRIQSDAAAHRISIPVLCPPGRTSELTLLGFRSAAGTPADAVKLSLNVTEAAFSKGYLEQTEKMLKDPDLLSLVERMKQERRGIRSLVEVVETISVSRTKDLGTQLTAQAATFKWQSDGKFFADAGGVMPPCNAFSIGCDGRKCWWYSDCGDTQSLVVGSPEEIQQKAVTICDPFGFLEDAQAGAFERMRPRYLGLRQMDGQKCRVFEAWAAQPAAQKWEDMVMGHLTEWWIDAANLRPVQVRFYEGGLFEGGLEARYRFHYEKVNQPIPDQEFAPPTVEGVNPEPVEPLDADYTTRFLNLMDGSSGHMSVRWGKQGPKGRSSSGLGR